MTYPSENIPAQIVPMILHRIKENIETELVHNVPEDNPTRVALVKVGRFQENPKSYNVSIAVMGGDVDNPDFLDARADHEMLDQIGIRYLPVGEIGGGYYWYRRGTITYQSFFLTENYDEETAMEYAYDLYGRLLKTVEETNVSDLVDDYGEKAYGLVFLESSTYYHSGGKGKHAWRGKLYFRVLTWRP